MYTACRVAFQNSYAASSLAISSAIDDVDIQSDLHKIVESNSKHLEPPGPPPFEDYDPSVHRGQDPSSSGRTSNSKRKSMIADFKFLRQKKSNEKKVGRNGGGENDVESGNNAKKERGKVNDKKGKKKEEADEGLKETDREDKHGKRGKGKGKGRGKDEGKEKGRREEVGNDVRDPEEDEKRVEKQSIKKENQSEDKGEEKEKEESIEGEAEEVNENELREIGKKASRKIEDRDEAPLPPSAAKLNPEVGVNDERKDEIGGCVE